MFKNSLYFGARYLNPKTGLWLSSDPVLGEYLPTAGGDNSKLPGMGGVYNPLNFALYHFVGNNPVRYTDPDGRAPGDEFDSAEDAVYDWAKNYYDDTQRNRTEYGSTLYSTKDKAGKKHYSYTIPNQGEMKDVGPSNDTPWGATREGIIHSHYGDNSFSDVFSDFDIANCTGGWLGLGEKITGYLINAGGDIRKLDSEKVNDYFYHPHKYNDSFAHGGGTSGESLLKDRTDFRNLIDEYDTDRKESKHYVYFLFIRLTKP